MNDFTEDVNNTSAQDFLCSARDTGKNLHTFIILALNIIISITAFLGNVLIIVALPKVTSLHSSSKLLFRSLATTDLCVGLILQPLNIAFLMSSENVKSCHYLETASEVAAVIFCGVSLLILTAISVDRFLALSLGLRYRQAVTLRRVKVCVALFWLSSIPSTVAYFYNYLITLAFICVVVLLYIATSTFCYTKIYLSLRHHQFQVQNHVHHGQPNGGGIPLNIPRYRKTVSSALWVQMALVACYLPFGISTVVVVFAYSDDFTVALAFIWELTFSLLSFNSSLNPFLYCWKIRGVRQAVKGTIRSCFCLSR